MRTRSLYMAVSLHTADQIPVSSGRQDVSFSYDQQHVKQRIDRDLTLGSVEYLVNFIWNLSANNAKLC